MMRAPALRLIVLVLMLLLGLPVQAQTDSPPLSSNLCEHLPAPGAPDACQTLNTCLFGQGFYYADSGYVTCIGYVTRLLLESCAPEACDIDTLMSVALLWSATGQYYDTGQDRASLYQDVMANTLMMYHDQQPADAADLIMTLYPDFPDRYLPYVAGLLYEVAGLTSEALEAYSQSIATEFYTALAYYSRGRLRNAMGDTTGAEQDFYTFNTIQANPVNAPLMRLTIPPVPLDVLMPASERMTLYLLSTYSASPGGEWKSYGMGRPGRPVEINWSRDGQFLTLLDFDSGSPRVTFFECMDRVCHRALGVQQTSPGLSDGSDSATITVTDDYLEVRGDFSGFESGGSVLSILVPEAMPDPRPQVPCEGGAFPLFNVGDTVWRTLFESSVHAAPDLASAVTIEHTNHDRSRLHIAGDLVCGPGGNWWPVTIEGKMVGWVGDTEGTSHYTAFPADWDLSYSAADILSLEWTPSGTVVPTPPSTPAVVQSPTLTSERASACDFTIPPGDTQALMDALQATRSKDHPVICLSPDSVYTIEGLQQPQFDGSSAFPISVAHLTIQGNGATLERAASAPSFRFFRVPHYASLHLIDLTLRGGQGFFGGAIRNDGNLTLSNVTITENRAREIGGAIYNTGDVFIESSDIIDNVSGIEGGGLANAHLTASAAIRNSRFQSNGSDAGSAIQNDGTLQVTDSVFAGNSIGTGGVLVNRFGTAEIHDSCFVGSADDIHTRAGYPVDARQNWWTVSSELAAGLNEDAILTVPRLTSQPEWCGQDVATLPIAPAPSSDDVALATTAVYGLCPGALPSRLLNQAYLRVLPSAAELAMQARSSPELSAGTLGQLLPDMGAVVITDGPICADGYAWWQIGLGNGQLGWIAEADSTQYWVQPAEFNG